LEELVARLRACNDRQGREGRGKRREEMKASTEWSCRRNWRLSRDERVKVTMQQASMVERKAAASRVDEKIDSSNPEKVQPKDE
jgi:hypothetical protein